MSMSGTTHQVSTAPPVRTTSTRFIAASIETMEIIDMPIAVLNAARKAICRVRMIVSSAMEVISPLTMARLIIVQTGQPMPVT